MTNNQLFLAILAALISSHLLMRAHVSWEVRVQDSRFGREITEMVKGQLEHHLRNQCQSQKGILYKGICHETEEQFEKACMADSETNMVLGNLCLPHENSEGID